MKNIDIVFNGATDNGKEFQLASGYISKTAILFEKEGVYSLIEASGRVQFFDESDTMLAEYTLPKIDEGKEKYEAIVPSVKDGSIVLAFPTYSWIDNYPHCDGEHDRWDKRKIGEITLTFNLGAKTIEFAE